jgi:hypothetical protein
MLRAVVSLAVLATMSSVSAFAPSSFLPAAASKFNWLSASGFVSGNSFCDTSLCMVDRKGLGYVFLQKQSTMTRNLVR